MGDAWTNETMDAGLEIGPSAVAETVVTTQTSTVWDRLTEPGYLKKCHPFCAATEVEQWPGEGARDSITYYSGRRYVRNFARWIEGEGYDIELGEGAGRTARVLWRFIPEGEDRTRVDIRVFPLLPGDMPEAKKQAILDKEFGADLQHYLDGVVKGIKHWIETGTPVTEDQFGWNPLYSAPRV